MADSVKVEKVQGAWRIDLTDWKVSDFAAWQEAANVFFLPDVLKLLPKAVKAWEFEGSPTDKAAYDTLTLEQVIKATREVSTAVRERFLIAAGSVQ